MIAPLSPRAFDRLQGHLISEASKQVVAWAHSPKVRDIVYLPGMPRFVGELLNKWSPSKHAPQRGEFPHVMGLLRQLFPDEAEREYIWDAIAFHAQNPGVKVRHAIMVRGPQGSGKNTLFVTILGVIFGLSNLRVLGGDALLSRFDDDWVEIEILIIDEVMHSGGWDLYNKLKPHISEKSVLYERKGVDRKPGQTARVIIILSNDHSPLPLDEGDRRFFVPAIGPSRLSSDFYQALHEALPVELPAFHQDLLDRDVAHFRPDAPPPMTAGKADLQASVRPPLERALRDWIDERAFPFDRDICLVEVMGSALKNAGYPANEGAIKKALKALGAVSLGQLPEGGGRWLGRPRCWAVRNMEDWKTAPPTAWAEHMTQSLTQLTPGGSVHHVESVVGPPPGNTIDISTFISAQKSELSKSVRTAAC